MNPREAWTAQGVSRRQRVPAHCHDYSRRSSTDFPENLEMQSRPALGSFLPQEIAEGFLALPVSAAQWVSGPGGLCPL